MKMEIFLTKLKLTIKYLFYKIRDFIKIFLDEIISFLKSILRKLFRITIVIVIIVIAIQTWFVNYLLK